MNKYTLQARFFPTILCSIPIIIFQYFFLSKEMSDFFAHLGKIKWAGDITITVSAIYFLSQLNRLIGKDLFEKKYFEDEKKMPTTNFLMFSDDQYSKEYKLKIHEKIKKDFGLSLSSEEEEKREEENSRRKIVEAVSMIRKKVGEGTLLLQHNIEYGFLRNFIGGSIPATLFSLINIYLAIDSSKKSVLIISIVLGIVYLSSIIFSKYLITRKGILYARILIQEYMA